MKITSFPPPIYRLDKINVYMISKLHHYLTEAKEQSKDNFDDQIFTQMFFESEIEEAKKLLSEMELPNRPENLDPYSMSLGRSIYGNRKDHESIHLEKQFYNFYIISLEKHLKNLSSKFEKKQPENLKIDEVIKERHNNIFVGNAFEVWQSMFDGFGITEESRTDVKFMFEEMKKDSLIYKSVSQVRFLEWIAENYNGMIIEKTSNHNKTKTRIAIYETAKTLYKN
ncbi:hypothetical protein SAMN05443669_103225 [Flavobacterium xanthum]|uniref:Uncharacterized protein n=2 Tax=Flavobacterium xanthum TaxID=69322 RepID=A0A1M7I5E7_9FLAO|nr:hypothetical protein SAMN05443669_103225 [Flavobacterium xanthum]